MTFRPRTLTQFSWLREFSVHGAIFTHDRNPRRPHPLLTSELHSNGYFNSGLVTEDSLLLDKVAEDMVRRLERAGSIRFVNQIDRVVGPAMGAIKIAHDVSRKIAERRGRPCLSAYTEPKFTGGKKCMAFKKSCIRPGEHVLLVDDTFTTGKSLFLTEEAVAQAGGIVLKYVCVMANRSAFSHVNDKLIIPLVKPEPLIWTPEKCPLCRAGSIAIHPKGENWARLNARYPISETEKE